MKTLSYIALFFLIASWTFISTGDKLDAYVEQSVSDFEDRILKRGGEYMALKEELLKELNAIDERLQNSSSHEEIIIEKLKCIEKYKIRLDQKFLYIEDMVPYAVLKGDSAVILFDVKQSARRPNVYLRQGNLAKQIEVNQYNPLTISLNKPQWSRSNPPVSMHGNGIGVYMISVEGRDKIFEIKNMINCR